MRVQPSFKVEDRRHDKVYTFDPSVQAETPEKGEVRPPTVQVHIPRNSLFALPHVELYKQGVFTSQELDRFAAILKVANSLPQDNIQVCHAGSNLFACGHLRMQVRLRGQ